MRLPLLFRYGPDPQRITLQMVRPPGRIQVRTSTILERVSSLTLTTLTQSLSSPSERWAGKQWTVQIRVIGLFLVLVMTSWDDLRLTHVSDVGSKLRGDVLLCGVHGLPCCNEASFYAKTTRRVQAPQSANKEDTSHLPQSCLWRCQCWLSEFEFL